MKAKQLSRKAQPDIISTLPQPVVEIILCLLPIEEAARTSTLSREWRYKWTTIPKLDFSLSTVSKRTTENNQLSDLELIREAARTSILSREWRYQWTPIYKLVSNSSTVPKETTGMNGPPALEQQSGMASVWKNLDVLKCKLFNAVHQVLLLHQGPIYEFSLSMNELRTVNMAYNCFEIDRITLHLSRTHAIKKLTLKLLDDDEELYKLPLSMFSLHHLTDLHLEYCYIDQIPFFNGFGSLTRLFLVNITISKTTLLLLLSKCPSLTRLSLLMNDTPILDYGLQFSITELFKCLLVIEDLTTLGHVIEYFIPDSAELPTLIHLKYFCLKQMGFVSPDELRFLAVLIKCSPNLEKIKLEIKMLNYHDDEDAVDVASVVFGDYSNIWLEHLNELEIECFRNYKRELELVKIILAKSPNLKMVKLQTRMGVYKTELIKNLTRTPRASQVEIIVG